MNAWEQFFNFLRGLSPPWVFLILVCLVLAYRAPDIVHAVMH